MEINKLQKEANKAKIDLGDCTESKALGAKRLKDLQASYKFVSDQHSSTLKVCDTLRKANKKEEHNRFLLKGNINEYQMQKEKIERDKADLELEQDKKENIINGLHEEMKLMVDKNERLESAQKQKNADLTGLRKKIEDYEKLLVDLQTIESNAVKTVKNLTTIRETMARKASAALAEVRETREELKIKELLILD